MAMRCSTALVDPPRAMVSTIAFSKALKVMMSLGLMSRFISSRMYLPVGQQIVVGGVQVQRGRGCDMTRETMSGRQRAHWKQATCPTGKKCWPGCCWDTGPLLPPLPLPLPLLSQAALVLLQGILPPAPHSPLLLTSQPGGTRPSSRGPLPAPPPLPHLPAKRHSSFLRGSSAGIDESYGIDMPSASIAHAMVLAVYMPPQAPAPGHEWRTMSERLASSMRPAEKAPAGGEGGK